MLQQRLAAGGPAAASAAGASPSAAAGAVLAHVPRPTRLPARPPAHACSHAAAAGGPPQAGRPHSHLRLRQERGLAQASGVASTSAAAARPCRPPWAPGRCWLAEGAPGPKLPHPFPSCLPQVPPARDGAHSAPQGRVCARGAHRLPGRCTPLGARVHGGGVLPTAGAGARGESGPAVEPQRHAARPGGAFPLSTLPRLSLQAPAWRRPPAAWWEPSPSRAATTRSSRCRTSC